MLPVLLPLIASLAPYAAKMIGTALDGKDGQRVAAEFEPLITGAAIRAFGTDDPVRMEERAKASPEKAAQFADAVTQAAQQMQAEVRMAEIAAGVEAMKAEVASVQGAREHQQKLAAVGSIGAHGANVLSVTVTVGFFGVFALMLWRPFTLDAISAQVVNIMTGVLGSAFTAVVIYWVGGSRNAQATNTAQAEQLGKAMEALASSAPATPMPPSAPPLPPPPPPVVVVPPAASVPAAPAVPAPAVLEWQQGPFGGVRFALNPDGYLVVEGEAAPGRTVGEPATVRRVWKEFGPIVAESCARNGVPLEVAVACICTESRGMPAAVLHEPDGRSSIGLMQVLHATAEEVMGRRITSADLAQPAIGIEAGVRYIAKQYPKTRFLPPLVAAAYNAGGLYPPREQDKNRWNLRSTGHHVDRFCLFFNDSVYVAKTDGWAH